MENVLDTIWVDFDYRISRGRGWNQEHGKMGNRIVSQRNKLENN